MPERKQYPSPPAMQLTKGASYTAVIHTNFGDMIAELYPEDAPKTVNNFVFLARDQFYDGVIFHRVIAGFMAQTGDPRGSGAGGPGYRFDDEPIKRDYERGTLAMANAGPNTNGSQFFICHADLRGRLDKAYTVFGKVIEGIEVLDKIARVPVERRSGEVSSPTVAIEISSIEIQESSAA